MNPLGLFLETPGPLLTHLHAVYMACSECLPTSLKPLAEMTCFSQVPRAGGGGLLRRHPHAPRWRELMALAADGVSYSSGYISGRRAGRGGGGGAMAPDAARKSRRGAEEARRSHGKGAPAPSAPSSRGTRGGGSKRKQEESEKRKQKRKHGDRDASTALLLYLPAVPVQYCTVPVAVAAPPPPKAEVAPRCSAGGWLGGRWVDAHHLPGREHLV